MTTDLSEGAMHHAPRGRARRMLVGSAIAAAVSVAVIVALAPLPSSDDGAGEQPAAQIAVATPQPTVPVTSPADEARRKAIAIRVAARSPDELQAAITALEETLPLQQGAALAATENELGLAKRLLGQANKDDELLRQAVAHYRVALSGFEAGADDTNAAIVRWNLAIALRLHGEAAKDNAALREAADLFRASLGDPDVDTVAANKNLGLVLASLGEAENDIPALREAVTALETALDGADTDNRDRVDWAETQNALANALEALGQREWDLGRLEAALKARRNARVLYESAGLDTYRYYFDTRIATLERLIEMRRAAPLTRMAADRSAPLEPAP